MSTKPKPKKINQHKITYKQDEEELFKYVDSHSSPSAWYKDLAKKEFEKEKRLGNCYNSYSHPVSREKDCYKEDVNNNSNHSVNINPKGLFDTL